MLSEGQARFLVIFPNILSLVKKKSIAKCNVFSIECFINSKSEKNSEAKQNRMK